MENGNGDLVSVKRSTLTAEWTVELCQWLFSLEIMSGLTPGPTQDVFYLHSEIQDMKVWHDVPVEKEANPDAMLRQQMVEQSDYKTKYDYISHGSSAT